MSRSLSNHRFSTTAFPTMAIILASALATGACNQRDLAIVPPTVTYEHHDDFDLTQNRALDLLFVIDNSRSMEAEQRSLVENFDNFVARLEQIEGGLPDVHIGIVSTDVGVGPGNTGCTAEGDRGLLLRAPSPTCQAVLPDDPFISDVGSRDGARLRNYPDSQTLSETFSCMAEIGTGGCGYEQPLESMRKALDPANLQNSGFLREDAYLAVVFITDEDDCSAVDRDLFGADQSQLDADLHRVGSFRCFAQGVICDDDDPHAPGVKQNCRARTDSPYMASVKEYADFLKALKGDEDRVIVAGITGDPEPVEVWYNDEDKLDLRKSCGEVAGEPYSGAVPATRLSAFLDEFPYSTRTSLCGADLSVALADIAALLRYVLDHRCLMGELRDIDPDTDGVQPNCAVIEVRYADTGYPQEFVLPRCDDATDPDSASNQPCYLFEEQEECAGTASSLEINIYPAERELPPGTDLQVRCEGN